MTEEIHYLLKIEGTGVITHEGGESKASVIREWLDTPQGSVWGSPWWGNTLSQYRHQPHDDDTASSIENSILLSIGRDLPHVQIIRIGVKPVDLDCWWVTIVTKDEIIEEGLNL